MRVLSLFAGVGGFDLGFERAGMEIAAQCEFDPHAQSVLRRHWPDVPLVSDVKDLRGADYPADVIVGGFPCQDVSVAGKREGLAGERSGLFFEAVRIIEEMWEATNGEYPKYVVIENVPGLLSSRKGDDFRTVVETLIQAEVPMPRSGKWAYARVARGREREVCWRVLDSQHFGVAQRRRRVFIVLGLGGRSATQILLEREGVPGRPPQGREAGESIAGTLEARTRGGGFPGTDGAIAGHIVPVKGPTPHPEAGDRVGRPSASEHSITPPVGFNWQNWTNDGLAIREDGVGPLDMSQTKAVAFPIQDDVRSEKRQNGIGVGEEGEPGYTLDATGHQAVAFAENSRAELRLEGGDGQRTGSLNGGGGKPGQGHPAIAFAMRGRAEGNVPEANGEQDPSYTLDATGAQAVAVNQNGSDVQTGAVATSLTAGTSKGTTGPLAFAMRGRAEGNVPEANGDQVNALRSSSGGSTRDMIAAHYAVRRLMPVETERLQAMPDDWTRYADDGKEIADTHRYRMVGNAVTVSVVEWLGRRVATALSAERELEEAA